jgi:hypothetical protein
VNCQKGPPPSEIDKNRPHAPWRQARQATRGTCRHRLWRQAPSSDTWHLPPQAVVARTIHPQPVNSACRHGWWRQVPRVACRCVNSTCRHRLWRQVPRVAWGCLPPQRRWFFFVNFIRMWYFFDNSLVEVVLCSDPIAHLAKVNGTTLMTEEPLRPQKSSTTVCLPETTPQIM